MVDLERYLGDRLTSDRCINRFTRTARVWCGNRGLERRGRLTRRVQRLLEDETEPNWSETFERWGIFVEFAATSVRPVPGAHENEQYVMLLTWGDGERRWLVHDVDAHAAVILPFEELQLPEEQLLTVHELATRFSDTEIEASPQRVFLEGVRYEGSDLHVVWLNDHELVPELGIYLPAHRGDRPRPGSRSERPLSHPTIV